MENRPKTTIKKRRCLGLLNCHCLFLVLTILPNYYSSENVQVAAAAAFTNHHLPSNIAIRKTKTNYQHKRQPQRQRWSQIRNILFAAGGGVSEEEIRERFHIQLAKLRERDRSTKIVSKEELKVLFEDEHLIVVDKPSGVLCVPSEQGVPSLAQTVFECVNDKAADNKSEDEDAADANANANANRVSNMDRMIVHRLGMDTSGLVVFAKTMDALRGMNTLFRRRKVMKQYEALVCGHISREEGLINLPLMVDYERPPFMRISTDEQQRFLMSLDPNIVGKKILEPPKSTLTQFNVISREELGPGKLPVSRITLTSITGRTHQLNVHCAAFGHPIVGDRIYGWEGLAAPNGGLDEKTFQEMAPAGASEELQQQIATVANAHNMNMCVHAKLIKFRHPITKKVVTFTSEPSF